MRPLAAAVAALALLAPGCRSHPFGEIEREDADAQLDRVEEEIAAGDLGRALQRLAAVHEVENLAPDTRLREERLVDRAAQDRFAQLLAGPPGRAAEELEELFESELPARARARAGLLAARCLLDEKRRITAFRLVKRVDSTLPGHPERVLAGDVLARAGLSLIRDTSRYNLLFHFSPRGVQVLEYLVVRYPLEPRCPEAYFALSEFYEEDGSLDESIERTEELLLYHPDSAYAAAAAARLPYLRLCRLQRDDNDRSQLLRARAEIETWLERHPGHELEDWVRQLHTECRARLVRSDLYLAGYHRKTHAPYGVRLHATRAEALAVETGLEEEAEAARALLRTLPPEVPREAAAAPVTPGETP